MWEGTMRPETAVSLALLALFQERGSELGFRGDVIDVIKKLRSEGVEVSGIRIRPGIEGEYSDEVSDFVGRLSIAGYIIQESPIRLTEKGVRLISRHVIENIDDPDVAKGVELLAIDRERIKSEPVAAS